MSINTRLRERTNIQQLCPDIWLEVLQFLNASEIVQSLVRVTNAVDEVLFGNKYRYLYRELILDAQTYAFLRAIGFDRVLSIHLHQGCDLNMMQNFTRIRSLKINGEYQWTLSLLRNLTQIDMELKRLCITIPSVGLLRYLLPCIAVFLSLRRLEVYSEQLEEKMNTDGFLLEKTYLQQFVLHSYSPINWRHLICMKEFLHDIRFLDITLSDWNEECFGGYIFPRIQHIHLRLLEVPFNTVVRIVSTIPTLRKIKLSGLVDSAGYIINHQWLTLFVLTPSVMTITINLTIQEGLDHFHDEAIRKSVREINLHLHSTEDDVDYCTDEKNDQHWWSLFGTINRHTLRMFS
jgi:hypothetical protein